jgi:hypothetical protein
LACCPSKLNSSKQNRRADGIAALRKAKARTFDVLAAALRSVTAQDVQGWFAH